MATIELIQPHKVQEVRCPKHKELLVKLYPWGGWAQTNTQVVCGKCENERRKIQSLK